ncbi:MAG: WbqC family protein, partial [Nitrososphaerales archaeon]
FPTINSLISEVLFSNENKISNLVKASVVAVSDYLGLKTQFVLSSTVYKNEHLNGSARIIDICHKEKTNQYYNLPGGKDLYDEKLFNLNGMELCFIQPELKSYRQFAPDFHPGLSIIDVLMFNDRDAAREMIFSFNKI